MTSRYPCDHWFSQLSAKRHRFVLFTTLIVLLAGINSDGWANGARSKRSKTRPAEGHTFDIEADESVAQQVNDPTAFLREIRMDTTIEHGAGSNHTIVEWIPTLSLPLSQRLRFEGGIPFVVNGPDDRDEVEPGDLYSSIAYVFSPHEEFSALLDFRIDLPTGNESRSAGLNITQWHATLGSVIYSFDEEGLLIIPFVEYRQSIFDEGDRLKVSSWIGSVGLVYLLSQTTYLRNDWTVNFDKQNDWKNSALLNLEVGHIFMDQYSVAVGYEFDLWGDAEIRNAVFASFGYLF